MQIEKIEKLLANLHGKTGWPGNSWNLLKLNLFLEIDKLPKTPGKPLEKSYTAVYF